MCCKGPGGEKKTSCNALQLYNFTIFVILLPPFFPPLPLFSYLLTFAFFLDSSLCPPPLLPFFPPSHFSSFPGIPLLLIPSLLHIFPASLPLLPYLLRILPPNSPLPSSPSSFLSQSLARRLAFPPTSFSI